MQTPILTKAFTAHANVPAKTLVAVRNDGTVEAASGTNSNMIGVSADVASMAGKACDVHMVGIAFVRAGAAFGAGDLLTSDASGRAVLSTTQGHHVVGVALQPSTSADEEVAVLINPTLI